MKTFIRCNKKWSNGKATYMRIVNKKAPPALEVLFNILFSELYIKDLQIIYVNRLKTSSLIEMHFFLSLMIKNIHKFRISISTANMNVCVSILMKENFENSFLENSFFNCFFFHTSGIYSVFFLISSSFDMNSIKVIVWYEFYKRLTSECFRFL